MSSEGGARGSAACDAAPPPPVPAPTPPFDELLTYSNTAFAVLSGDGAVLYMSPSVARVFAVEPAALVGRSILEIVHQEDRSHLSVMLWQVRDAPVNSAPSVAHLRVQPPSVSPGPLAPPFICEIKLSSDGTYLFATVRDVREELRVEETLRCFLLSTSHDLHTPCHGAQCASELLAERPGINADRGALDLLDAVRASCSLMLTIIQNVLDLKMLEESGGTGCSRSSHARSARDRVDLRALPADVLGVCRIGCGKDIVLHEDPEKAVPDGLEGDAERTRLILQNAAMVAVTLAGPAAVTATLFRCSCGDGEPSGCTDCCVSFMLHGRALSPAETGAAFDAYSGCDGLALLVARTLSRAMDSDVWLRCVPDSTSIVVRIRLLHAGAPLPEELPSPTPAAVQHSPAPAVAPPMLPPLQLSARMFEHMTANSDDVFTIMATGGPDEMRFEYVNESISRWGLCAADMIGTDPRLWKHPDDLDVGRCRVVSPRRRADAFLFDPPPSDAGWHLQSRAQLWL